MTKLKNYTSAVPASTSISRIEQALVAFGASDIAKSYDPETRICKAIRFKIRHQGNDLMFELEANTEACFKVLWAEIKRPRPDTKKTVTEQAERTAWKIWADWVEIQLSLILMEQVQVIEIFLPFAYSPNHGRLYPAIAKTGITHFLPPSK